MAETSIDRKTIEEWVAKFKGKPAAVKKTHGENAIGTLRIMFPVAPNSEHDDLVEISWDEFFKEFEAKKLALLYESDSMFNKLVDRDTSLRQKGAGSVTSDHNWPPGKFSKDE
ncbi:hypothetical protein [Pollutimonas nitritireducens]|uniref:hypothetical protein n=1 Tax=Pollutimonas nitritireducens TaxID=2045209 RepID=UPI0018EE0FA9|nr:hypothetical protein [Pollutimonas nitritireducens]